LLDDNKESRRRIGKQNGRVFQEWGPAGRRNFPGLREAEHAAHKSHPGGSISGRQIRATIRPPGKELPITRRVSAVCRI
jgi:hypothetical protein